MDLSQLPGRKELRVRNGREGGREREGKEDGEREKKKESDIVKINLCFN